MRVVIVKGLAIGAGEPKIIVPITDASAAAAVATAAHFATIGAIDMVEFRVDFLTDALDGASVAQACGQVAQALDGKPLLVTFRTKAEGGETAITDEAYAALYAQIVAAGHADLIDVELVRTPAIVRQIVADAHRAGVPVILSNHDFQGTPPAAELVRRLRQMQDLDADIVKIAVMPRDAGDVLQLLTATWEMQRLHAERPVITMAMAGTGALSRLSGELFGSAATFGMVGKASAPGQIDVHDLRTALDILHRALVPPPPR